MNVIECGICYDDMYPIEIRTSSHDNICQTCVKYYLKLQLQKAIKLSGYDYYRHEFPCLCDEPDSCPPIIPANIFSKNYFDKIFATNCGRFSLVDFKLTQCPEVACKKKLINNKCNKCKNKYCPKCNGLEHLGQCDQKILKNKIHTILAGEQDVQKCQNCKTMIFRSGGCDNMFCWNCSTYIDWETGDPHYSKLLRVTCRKLSLIGFGSIIRRLSGGTISGYEGTNYYQYSKHRFKQNKDVARLDN